METYDVVVIGGGSAGVTAAIYAIRYRLKTLLISENIGGTILDAHKVENYPGYKSLSGMELGERFEEHLKYLGVEVVMDEVQKAEKTGAGFRVYAKGKAYDSRSIIIALGTQRRKLNLPDEDKFLGKGVSYCSTCDAPFFGGKVVGVVGGSDASASAAVLAAKYAKRVYIIYRRDKLRAEPAWVDEINKNRNIEVIYKANVAELRGGDFLSGVKLDTGRELGLEGLFIEIGGVPSTFISQSLGVKLDENGYIMVESGGKTNVPGVFAAGDITNGSSVKQLITAAAEGAEAANSVFKYLRGTKKNG